MRRRFSACGVTLQRHAGSKNGRRRPFSTDPNLRTGSVEKKVWYRMHRKCITFCRVETFCMPIHFPTNIGCAACNKKSAMPVLFCTSRNTWTHFTFCRRAGLPQQAQHSSLCTALFPNAPHFLISTSRSDEKNATS